MIKIIKKTEELSKVISEYTTPKGNSNLYPDMYVRGEGGYIPLYASHYLYLNKEDASKMKLVTNINISKMRDIFERHSRSKHRDLFVKAGAKIIDGIAIFIGQGKVRMYDVNGEYYTFEERLLEIL